MRLADQSVTSLSATDKWPSLTATCNAVLASQFPAFTATLRSLSIISMLSHFPLAAKSMKSLMRCCAFASADLLIISLTRATPSRFRSWTHRSAIKSRAGVPGKVLRLRLSDPDWPIMCKGMAAPSASCPKLEVSGMISSTLLLISSLSFGYSWSAKWRSSACNLISCVSSSQIAAVLCLKPNRHDTSQKAIPFSSTLSTSWLLESRICTDPYRKIARKLEGSPTLLTNEPADNVTCRQVAANCSRKGSEQPPKSCTLCSHLKNTLRPIRVSKPRDKPCSTLSIFRMSTVFSVLEETAEPEVSANRICSANSGGSPEFCMKVSTRLFITRSSTVL
mmetsp:Transcript_27705/g.65790  ORF Transcript_27705/g.65790 Transcript_27705/m.65790 type:complete len:335 (-) Transcript_27705:1106-2110(-)